MIADKVGYDILDDLDEFLKCVRLDIEAGNVRGYDVVTARGFVIADSYDVAHDPHLGASDFGQRPASQLDALSIHKMGLSGSECKFYGFRSRLSVSVRRMAAARAVGLRGDHPNIEDGRNPRLRPAAPFGISVIEFAKIADTQEPGFPPGRARCNARLIASRAFTRKSAIGAGLSAAPFQRQDSGGNASEGPGSCAFITIGTPISI